MARAKRTDRADARRRNRVTQAEEPDVEGQDDAEDQDAASAGASGSGRRPAQASAASRLSPARPIGSTPPPPRPSFTGSFRAAARPINIREDIAYLPTLFTHLPDARAIWIPAAAAIASGVFFLASTPLGTNGIANLVFQLFVLPPTIAGSFLAGILAPRATYIAGGVAALVGALVFSVAVLITPTSLSAATLTPSPSPGASVSASDTASAGASASAAPVASASPAPSASAAPGGTASTITDFDKTGAIIQSLALSVPFGIAIGAFGGYYKRFLYLSNPNRQRRAQEQQRAKTTRQGPPKKRF